MPMYDIGKDYKKMYWDLVEKIRKIVDDANIPLRRSMVKLTIA